MSTKTETPTLAVFLALVAQTLLFTLSPEGSVLRRASSTRCAAPDTGPRISKGCLAEALNQVAALTEVGTNPRPEIRAIPNRGEPAIAAGFCRGCERFSDVSLRAH